MPEPPAYPFDAAICRLLAGGPLSTAAIADRLATSDRTARRSLARLRQAGMVVTDPDRLHRLAAGTSPAAEDLDEHLDEELAASGPTPATSGNVPLWVAMVAFALGCVVVAIWACKALGTRPTAGASGPAVELGLAARDGTVGAVVVGPVRDHS